MIGIVDLGRGNIGSVKNAVEFLGRASIVLGSPSRIDECDRVILPGVGSFFNSMNEMKGRGFDDALRNFAARGGRILGICLGMQLLASFGSENGEIEGVGLIPGHVCRMNVPNGLRLPHVGWNGVERMGEHPLFRGVKKCVDFYFTHSYVFEVENEAHSIGKTLYGECFTSAVATGNVWGVQFHPEKSQKNGLRILKNFLEEGAEVC
jgi:imidazole glycerol-phosphate synthase subunit HisH